MSINTVKIERIKNADGTFPQNSVTLTGSYTVNGKLRVLKDNGQYAMLDVDDKTNPQVRDYNFGKAHPSLTYSYNTDLITTQDKETKKTIDIFWGEHPLLRVNGKVHAGTSPAAMFNIVDANEESVDNINKFNDQLNAVNKIASMSDDERRNVAYYYGQTPNAKSDSDLKLLLANFNNGICFLDAANFLKVWGDNSNTDRDIVVVLKKAVVLGVIPNKIIDGRNNYYLGTELIGTSENDLLSYAKNNTKTFEEFIVREVNAKDVVPKKETSKPANINNVTGKTFTINEVAELREEARQLKSEGFLEKGFIFGIASAPKLVEEISKGKALKEESRKKQLAES